MLEKAAAAYARWHGALQHFPRLSRYTLGTKIDLLFSDLLECILLASYAGKDQKRGFILRASSKLDLLKFFLQLAWELKVLDNKKYLGISAPLTEVGKMLGGWQRQVVRETPGA